MSTMTRSNLAVEMSLRLDISVDRAKAVVDTLFDVITESLMEGKRIEFRNFGVFEVVDRKPKVGRNPLKPNDGEYHIPARKMVRFRTGKHLFVRLNPDQT